MNLIINEENHFFGIYDNDKYYVNKTTSKKPGSSKSSSKGTSKSTSKPSSSSSSKSSSKSNSGSKSSSGSGGKSTSGSVSSSKSSSGSGGKSTSGVTPTSIKNADNRNTGYKAASSGYKPSTSSSSGYKSTSGVTPTSIKNTDNRNTGYKAASSGYKSTTSFSSSNKSTAIYKLSPGVTPTSIKNTDNRNTGYKAASSGYQYLRTARAEALGKNNYYIDGSIGNNFKRNLVYDELDLSKATNDKNIEAKDLKSFIDSVSKHTPVYYDKGEKLYVVDSEASGVLSVGPGIVLKYNNDYFKKYDLDVSNLREGATIPASIVDQVTNDILADKRKYVLNVLETNNIKGLSDSQIDALTSRAYSVGNISNFPNMYKQYGNTEELYNNYLSTVNGKDTIYEKELTERRNAEIDLFKNGYSSVEEAKENLRPGLTPTAINKIEKIKRSKKSPTAINSQDRLKDGYVNNDGILSNLRPGLTPSEINRQDKIKNQENVIKKGGVKDPLANYLEELKAKGIDTSDITDSSKSPQERSHAAPSSYYNDGHSLIEFSEGHTPLSADGKSYMVDLDPGSGHPLAVGKGVLLKANETLFAQEGIDVNNYKAGDYLPVDVVDRVGMRIEENKRNEILKMAQDNNIVLTDYQVDALISRSYQFGNVDGFPAAYKAANGDVDTFINNYMLSGGGDSNRRQREADVFKNGYV